MNNWDPHGRIPFDLLFDMLIKQSVKTLCVLKCVSTVWRSIILDPVLLEKVVYKKPFNLDNGSYAQNRIDFVKIARNGVGLIVKTDVLHDFAQDIETLKFHKGLICYFNSHLHQLILFNKEIGYGYHLPDMPGSHFEFGFDPSCEKYKVLCWTPRKFYVLTIGEFSWKPIRGLLQAEIYNHLRDSVVINGTVFWLGLYDRSPHVVGFNLANERFGIIALPPELDWLSTFKKTCTLFEFDSRLCLVQCYNNLLNLNITEMWILKDIRNNRWVSIMRNPIVPLGGTKLVTCAQYEAQFFSRHYEILVATSNSVRQYIFVYCLLTRQFRRIDVNFVNRVRFTHFSVRRHVKNYIRFREYESSSDDDDDDDDNDDDNDDC